MNAPGPNLVIRTPEGIEFPLSIASPISRFLAVAIDLACISAASAVLSTVFRLLGFIHADLAGALLVIAVFVFSVGYPMVFEWYWQGRTIGKRVLRLQVMDAQGLKLQPGQVIIRNLLRAVDALPMPPFYLVGGLACLATRHSQRLGDLAANTIVVYHPRIEEPELDTILPDKYNSFRDYPHLAARLRQNTTAAEAALALDALIRRDELEPEARLALFADIRRHLETKVRFPAEVGEALSDEQYVRNAVDTLYRPTLSR